MNYLGSKTPFVLSWTEPVEVRVEAQYSTLRDGLSPFDQLRVSSPPQGEWDSCK